MRVDLLSAGPSVLGYHAVAPADRGAVRIGVNRAVTQFACHWWAACDWFVFEQWRPLAAPGGALPAVFTIPAQRDVIAARLPDRHALHNWLTWDQVRPGAPPDWEFSSSVSALVLAWHLGATRIDVYGVDMAGDCDFGRASDNPAFDKQVAAHRNPDRWAREQPVWDRTVRWLTDHAITVVHHTPTPTIHTPAAPTPESQLPTPNLPPEPAHA